MSSLNKVTLIGNLGRDPETKTNADGGKIICLSLATSEVWRDKVTGERKERTEWHRVVIFNERLGEAAENFLRKGSKVYIEGQSQTRKWINKKGDDVYTTEIVLSKHRGEMKFLGRFTPDGVSDQTQDEDPTTSEIYQQSTPSNLNDLDDEIPF